VTDRTGLARPEFWPEENGCRFNNLQKQAGRAEGTAHDEGQELAQGVEAEGRIRRGPPWAQGIRA
jgi:hypothetical protein